MFPSIDAVIITMRVDLAPLGREADGFSPVQATKLFATCGEYSVMAYLPPGGRETESCAPIVNDRYKGLGQAGGCS